MGRMYETYVKRALDVTLSGCALAALSPVMGVTALLVRCKLGSPVIFHQDRPGKDEQLFRLYKPLQKNRRCEIRPRRRTPASCALRR